jgi:hypothetical protein
MPPCSSHLKPPGFHAWQGASFWTMWPLVSYVRSMCMATRLGTSTAGRAKQEQFGALSGTKLHAECHQCQELLEA